MPAPLPCPGEGPLCGEDNTTNLGTNIINPQYGLGPAFLAEVLGTFLLCEARRPPSVLVVVVFAFVFDDIVVVAVGVTGVADASIVEVVVQPALQQQYVDC